MEIVNQRATDHDFASTLRESVIGLLLPPRRLDAAGEL
jgi:hypothetical protein